ncbi:MAG: PhoH family protein [Mogibacterium diversum]|jgi:phoH family protein|uniref:PhoH family protein n=1 Tax=Mogibacterium diversum TaxID=114527 RepID=UPI001CAC15CD|nr:PhoH family protein [Mogibacterium diversum]MBF1319704.1 PhoH family protein [Mogibacterium diversum]MBF1359017.1 PhoH family protein [Mogibacterium diversum]UQF80735.1 MAG: PhoH family protein [Mogibacterium diversum]
MDNSKDIVRFEIPEDINREQLFGTLDANIKQVEKATGTSIVMRDDGLFIKGTENLKAANIINRMVENLRVEPEIDARRVNYLIDLEQKGESFDAREQVNDVICYTHRGKPLRPKTKGQKRYIDTIRRNDMVFGIGPAGTGKTYLACALAANALKNKEVERIILARPAVEAGESLGFLPGDLQDKVDPYLRPLYDAIFEIVGQETAARLKESGVIEVVPLAYMRGRTLDNSFIILDEAQNTTREQMKMFLTRMGFNSKVVVTGDITQIDLPKGAGSGLVEAKRVLSGVEGVEFSYLTEVDVVRHELVKRIIKAYSDYEDSNNSGTNVRRGGSKR